MSAPAPATVKVLPDSEVEPGTVDPPMSLLAQGLGRVPGVPVPEPEPVWRFVNFAVAVQGLSRLVTAMPTYVVPGMLIVALPAAVHVVPSADRYPVNTLPRRASRSQVGAAPD